MKKFRTLCRVTLTAEQETNLRHFLNLHYLGDEKVCYLNDEGILIPKYPEKETQEYINAIKRVLSCHEIDIELIFNINGVPTSRIIFP